MNNGIVLSTLNHVQHFPKTFLTSPLFSLLRTRSKYLQAVETEPVQEPHQEGRGEGLSAE